MSKLGQDVGKVTGTDKQAEQEGRGVGAHTDPDVPDKPTTTPVPPELPLDDDGNDARNIGG
jgi:hypothetical protein